MRIGLARLARLVVSVALIIVAATRTLAQGDDTEQPLLGVRRDGPVLSESAVRTSCPGFVERAPIPPDAESATPPHKTWCTVDSTYALPQADSSRWLAAVYAMHREYDADEYRREARHVTRDTVLVITAVLFSSRRTPDPWRVEWSGTVAQQYVYRVLPDLVPRPDGSALVGVLYCINGTAGCWQRYLRRLGGTWTGVVEAFWKQVPPITGGRIGKGMGIALKTLSGSYGVYADDDANCCPSRELLLRLDQRGDTLFLKSHQIRKSEP